MKKVIALGLAGALAAASIVATTGSADAAIKHPKTAIVAGALFGFALGSLAANSYYNSYYYPYYYTPRPVYPLYPSYTYNSHAAACAATYRSYNPATDTYIGYDGYPHRCVLGY